MRRVRAALLGAMPRATRADADTYVQVERGRYLATVGDCVACHTRNLAGGRGIETPFGTLRSANITPDDRTGIGRWTTDGFYGALHDGHRPDGAHLYPAFPYNYYTLVTRADTDAIFAFLKTVPPVSNQVERNALPWPFSMRVVMVGWNLLSFAPRTWTPDPNRSDEFNRGAYLVEGLGHCSACHTPMNWIGAPKETAHLQGNQIQDWVAPNLTNSDRLGLGASMDDVVAYLRTGRNARSAASGPMAEVVSFSTPMMSDTDLRAMATYLKQRGTAGGGARPALAASDPTMQEGATIYVDNCSSCHTRDGTGIPEMFPRLAGSQVGQQDDPTTILRILVTGTRAAATEDAPTAPAMPSFGWRLSDRQVAAVATFIRNSWGNTAGVVSEGDAARVRGKVASRTE